MIPQSGYYTDVNLRHLSHIFRKSCSSEHFLALDNISGVSSHITPSLQPLTL